MNAVEIEEAVSALVEQPFDGDEFPFSFLAAFGNKETTIKRLRAGSTNISDIPGGVLQRNNIHIAVTSSDKVTDTLAALRNSPATAKGKVRFILATDGKTLEAEELVTGDSVACPYSDMPNHFGFFLALAGITTVQQIRDSSFDIRATSKLNRLYVELLQENPEWGMADQRHEMNHFMARLIFCFFAERTGIFSGRWLFTSTFEQMSNRDATNTHEIISEIFRAMNTPMANRSAQNLPRWTNDFPYVNGGLFSGSVAVPYFTKIARSYLIHIGSLDWTMINPDIFGSMIQAVADDEERGALGMHYTSVPNILKVLNPLFLDNLWAKLEEAGDNSRMLLNLRRRMARMRVFDPACGSGNFLVIAYKEMRAIEAEINIRRGESERVSDIPLTNFRGIELRDFPAEIARLALIITEFQCDMKYRGQKLALAEFLPLKKENWITCGNALHLDWLSICPPTGSIVKHTADDLFRMPLDQSEIDFENEGGETYICGNPPYLGSTWQGSQHKESLKAIFGGRTKSWKSLDYVAGWFMKAADYGTHTDAEAAFVATNSICQGQQVPILWPLIFKTGHEIAFAHTSFKWSNLASNKAGVTVIIVGLSNHAGKTRRLYALDDEKNTLVKEASTINAYLVAGVNVIVEKQREPISSISAMDFGNKPVDGGHLLLSQNEVDHLDITQEQKEKFIRPVYGSSEYIRGILRFCIWVPERLKEEAMAIPALQERFAKVADMRSKSAKAATREGAKTPYKFDEVRQVGDEKFLIIPRVSSENRFFLPVGYVNSGNIVIDSNFALYDAPLWNMALIASRMHLLWIGTVCGKLKTDFRYSNIMGWNTFPVPTLTEKNKTDLTRCAEGILLAREAHFPATIAELYDPARMPDNLREAHARNDEVLERIYIGRRFRNDTERLEKLFDLYTKMTTRAGRESKQKRRGA